MVLVILNLVGLVLVDQVLQLIHARRFVEMARTPQYQKHVRMVTLTMVMVAPPHVPLRLDGIVLLMTETKQP